jgi:glycosyltransferase involved in cell wall biosynthesis
MSVSKKVLFVSGIDFKEKSIQVIRKTPEAYIRRQWTVHYIVGRDRSKFGDYFYEPVINPTGVHLYRFSTPLAFLDELWNNGTWKGIAFRIRNLFLTIVLTYKAIKLIKKHDFDILYGYELYGVWALRIARALGFGSNKKFIIRFQGVYAGEWERKKQWYRKIANWDYFTGLKTKADLCIMTNDGTRGIDLLKKLENPTPKFLFFVNGVDEIKLDPEQVAKIRQEHFSGKFTYFISVSRLVPQKRVDRSIRVIHALVHEVGVQEIRYKVIGSGAEYENLKKLIIELDVEKQVELLGPVKNSEVKNYMACAQFFFSMDTISNVGNPLLEAIRNNKLIITLNNGDTASWISHLENGLLYDVNEIDLTDSDYLKIATDIANIIQNPIEFSRLKNNLLKTEKEKLWTWEERMDQEITNVEALLNG